MNSLRTWLRTGAILTLASTSTHAQWDPDNGQWGKSNSRDVRIMTWNVEDGICSSNDKTEEANSGFNDWHGIVRIIAALQPDVLVLQETADNSGNGTGSGSDSVSTLNTVVGLMMNGGTDPFEGGTITAYVKKYAPSYDLPFVFASSNSDGFNRNLILSRFPFTDLNGDGISTYSDIPSVIATSYAPGGDGGIRGFQFAEIDLPDADYSGDLVVGNAHLKAGGSQSDEDQRLDASQNVAYFVDHWYNGADAGTPDPDGRINDSPAATMILDDHTPVVLGGDWNEDEDTNGRKGPARWLSRAETNDTVAFDGPDRDRTDCGLDEASTPISGNTNTIGSSKLDYISYQDSIALLIREVIFDSDNIDCADLPAEVQGFPFPEVITGWAADHNAVFLDLRMPACTQLASSTNYGTGVAGTLGVPDLVAVTEPNVGGELTVSIGNSAGVQTAALLFFGSSQTAIPGFWGGDLLVNPILTLPLTIPDTGLVLSLNLDDNPALCGVPLYFQVIEGDAGATKGVAASMGLEQIIGS